MALVADIRKNVIDTTPVFAAVGLTDLAVEKVRIWTQHTQRNTKSTLCMSSLCVPFVLLRGIKLCS